MNNDNRRLRAAQSALASDLGRAFGDDGPAPETIVVKTTSDPGGGAYPTAAGSFFPVVRQRVGGTEEAGETVTLTDLSGVFWAGHVGSTAPPIDTEGLIATLIDGIYLFEYNG